MDLVLIQGGAVNEYIIKKHQYKFSQKLRKDAIHEVLKCGRSIAEAKRHYCVFIMPLVCGEGSLGDIFWLHSDLMVARSQVQLGEDFCTMKLIHRSSITGMGNLFLIVILFRL
jgi:hypothetical protein